MPSFGKRSLENLATVHPKLRLVLSEAIKHFDFTCIDGHRDEPTQNEYYDSGVSKVRWPDSKHNSYPSRAVDIVPYPGAFENEDEKFYLMATYVFRAAARVGVRLVWGGHWRNFKDLAHFELEDME